LGGLGFAGAGYEVLDGFGPSGEVEGEAVLEQDGGDGAAALEDEFGFRAEDDGSEFEHPTWGGKAEGHAPGFAQIREEVLV
jgi:hypothetical protein